MDIISPSMAQLAMEHCQTAPFEQFSQTMMGSVLGQSFRPLGGVKDGGADGFIDNDILEHVVKSNSFFQASKELDTEGKIRRTIKRLKEVGRDPRTLYYTTSRDVKYIDQLQVALSEELDCNIRIYDRSFLVQRVNADDNTKAAFLQYLRPAIVFLEESIAVSFPVTDTLRNAQQLSAFLGQETERRLGRTKALESICDALILWSLEETNPDKSLFMTEEQIVSKIEEVVPSVKQFFRGEVKGRLSQLTKKQAGARQVASFDKKGTYYLPFESREALKGHVVEDEALKSAVTAGIRQRLIDASDTKIGENMQTTVCVAVHKTLERLFETQGFDISRHFLAEEPVEPAIPPMTIIEIAENELEKAGVYRNKSAGIHLSVRKVLSGLFYGSDEVERRYLGRLARTYMMLFAIKNTPEVIEYFNSMAKTFYLYVGSDLLIRAMSEYYLPKFDQMTVNAFEILKVAGSKLVLTEQMLEEVHSHINASNHEYRNHYLEVDAIVDRDLASECDRILIRAYYYAKLEKSSTRPQNWGQFLNNFLTASKISGPKSTESMRSLKETLCLRFGFEYESRVTVTKDLQQDEVKTLSEKLVELKGSKREELAINDAELLLRVVRRRKDKEERTGNPFGFKSWYLTQDTKSKAA